MVQRIWSDWAGRVTPGRGETGIKGATGPVGDTGLQGKTGAVGLHRACTPVKPACKAPPALSATPGRRVGRGRSGALVHEARPAPWVRSALLGQGRTGPVGTPAGTGAAGQVGFGASVLGSSIYLYWPFRAGTGMTVEDMTTVGSRPGTLSAAGVTWVQNGTLGHTLSFGGTGSVRTDYQTGILSGTLSFEAFIIGDNFAAQAINFVVGLGFEAYHLTVTSAGYLRYYFTDEFDYQEVIGQTALETGRLYHVAATHDAASGITRLYVDGVEDGVLTGHAAFDVEDIRVIVGRSTDNTNGFRGIIDEVRL